MGEPETEKTVKQEAVVTDEVLDSALTEPEVELEAKEEKTEKAEPEEDKSEQRLRSWVGRKLKPIEEQLGAYGERLETILSRLEQANPQQYRQPEEEEPEVISSSKDVEKVVARLRQREMTEQQKYELGYINQLKQFAGRNPDLHAEIVQEMMANFNVKHSTNPMLDARANYAEAKAAILSKKIATPAQAKPNVANKKPVASTNISVESESVHSGTPDIELDAEAQEFLNRIGADKNWAKEALKGESPIHLKKR